MKKLRVAQVGTIWETTPPKTYGGTERVTHDLTEELVRQGHKVTLFATADSKTSAKLEHTTRHALYRKGIDWNNFLYPLEHIANAFERAEEFDIIHMHLNSKQDYIALVLAGFVKTPVLFTMHFMLPEKKDKQRLDRYNLLLRYKSRNFVTLSRAQQTLPFLNYTGVVYNGLKFPETLPAKHSGKYLLWLGRTCYEKGTLEAIKAAKLSGLPLILAGKIDKFNAAFSRYYEKKIKKHIDGKHIKYIGEVSDKQKISLFKNAITLLQPLMWNEPFGLTTIEAFGAGVPVIAFDKGPIREIMKAGVTGFVVNSVKEMVQAIKKLPGLDPQKIRRHALDNFSSEKMARDYLNIYNKLTNT